MEIRTEGTPRQRKPHGRHPEKALIAAKVRTAGPGRYADGNGLFLQVDPSGARRWVQRIVIRGKRRDLGLGSCSLVTLAEAREFARENRKIARSGGDPQRKRRTRIVPTLAEAFEAVVAIRRPTWTDGGKSEGQWRASFRDYVSPRLGGRPVDSIDTPDVLAVLTPLWSAKPMTGKRVRQRFGTVMKWAIAQGFRSDNPAGDAIALALPTKNGGTRAHHAALPWNEVPRFLECLHVAKTRPLVKSAIEFAILTAARSGEVRLATWDEIDVDARVWTIPAERMKAGREHRVPLSVRALAILDEARTLDDGSSLIFPSSRRGRPMDAARLLRPLRNLGFDATLHGFRSSFRDWCGEATNTPREVAEAALAHVVSNAAEAAYARSDLFEKRRPLMDRWAAFIAGEDGRIIPMAARRD